MQNSSLCRSFAGGAADDFQTSQFSTIQLQLRLINILTHHYESSLVALIRSLLGSATNTDPRKSATFKAT
jgi:hypothetical protein